MFTQFPRILHAWPGRSYPSSLEEEMQFVKDLTLLVASTGTHDTTWNRNDLTLVVTALRAGISLERLVYFVPEASPAALLSAYLHLEVLRAASVAAWEAIKASKTASALLSHRIYCF